MTLVIYSRTKSSEAIQRGFQGFLLGAVIFAILSFAAIPAWKAISPELCRIHPPEQRFPSFTCTLLGSLAAVLWLGPAGFIMEIISWETPLFVARMLSGLFVALLSASLFLALGRRRGMIAFLLSSIILVGILTILVIPLATGQPF